MVVRAKTDIEDIRGGKQQIVITEVPYEVVKANLVKKMDELRFDKKVEGIAEVRDDTDRTGLRIVIEVKKEADAEGILNYLYKNTDLQVTYNFNMVAIHNRTPQLLGLKQLLHSYITHQKEVVTNRSRHELRKAKERQHIVEGLKKAISILDEVIETIRSSKDKKDAKDNLISRFEFSEPQAEAIVTLQLYRLTNTDITTLDNESNELAKEIEKLERILSSEKNLFAVIKKDLKKIKKTYGDERRTVIEEKIQELKIDLEVMVPSEDVIVSVTKEGYVKRTSLRSYSSSKNERPGMKETDDLIYFNELNTTDTLLLFTKKGQYLYMPIHELPDIRWKDNGQHVGNIVQLDREDELLKAIAVKEFTEDSNLLFFTKNGMAKKTSLQAYQAQRYSKALVAVKVKENDEVVNVEMTNGNEEVFIGTKLGYGLRFHESEVSLVGQRAAGVKGINLKDGDEVINGLTFDPSNKEQAIIGLITQRGSMKKMPIQEFETSSRAKRGLVMLRELKSKPHQVVGLEKFETSDVIAVQTENDEVTHIETSILRTTDRYSNGSFVVDTKKNGDVSEAWKYTSHIKTEEQE